MTLEQNPVEEHENEDVWLIVKLREQNFAVNCQNVLGIFRADMETTQMAGYSSYVRGVIDFRGAVVPLLELRNVLGVISFEQEHEEFCEMMELRKGDHERWVQELQRCVHEGDEFKLATDPHKCAFGKWYDHYHSNNQSILFDLKKIDEPHKNLHATAEKVFACKDMQDAEKRGEKQEQLMNQASQELMPKILQLMDDMKDLYKSGYKEMCVVISNEQNKMMGLLVDEVNSVESLQTVESKSLFDSAFSSSCIDHVAKSVHINGEIFVLDKEALFGKLF
ncbi:chemotaxis protein CheW [Aminipila terrae]|uniref:CheW-like domain-containing protein n=1 Tax=Aminipila terrae TaxID=2697030 RepID=A0A6P1ME77_9FIRM|nr:chemotaxis protein CheW [Aminipila terrae]QHI71433.1 hypothetical protein Ami3637_02695 [Aminipila terrae]